MTERGRGALPRGRRHSWRSARARWPGTGDALTMRIDEVTVPIPSRLRGTVRLHPQRGPTMPSSLDGGPAPLVADGAAARGSRSTCSGPALRWSGTGYLDTNAGDEPLEAGVRRLGLVRVAGCSDEAAVLYEVRRRDGSEQALALRFRPDGSVERLEPPPQRGAAAERSGACARRTRSEAVEAGGFAARSRTRRSTPDR